VNEIGLGTPAQVEFPSPLSDEHAKV
jgi:hypothetical protein